MTSFEKALAFITILAFCLSGGMGYFQLSVIFLDKAPGIFSFAFMGILLFLCSEYFVMKHIVVKHMMKRKKVSQ